MRQPPHAPTFRRSLPARSTKQILPQRGVPWSNAPGSHGTCAWCCALVLAGGIWCCALAFVGAAGAVLLRSLWQLVLCAGVGGGSWCCALVLVGAAGAEAGLGPWHPWQACFEQAPMVRAQAGNLTGCCFCSLVTGHRRMPSQVGHCCLLGHWAHAGALPGWSLLLNGHWAQADALPGWSLLLTGSLGTGGCPHRLVTAAHWSLGTGGPPHWSGHRQEHSPRCSTRSACCGCGCSRC